MFDSKVLHTSFLPYLLLLNEVIEYRELLVINITFEFCAKDVITNLNEIVCIYRISATENIAYDIIKSYVQNLLFQTHITQLHRKTHGKSNIIK